LLARYWTSRGGLAEARVWLERALLDPSAGDLRTRLRLYNSASWIASFQGEHDLAFERGQTALQLAEELGDIQQQISVLNAHGGAALYRGDIPRAIRHWEDAVNRAEASLTAPRVVGVMHNLALGCLYNGEVAKARSTHLKARELARESSDLEVTCLSLLLQVEIELVEDNIAEAYELLEQVVGLAQHEATESLIVDTAHVGGALAVAKGQFETGALLIGSARASRSRMGFAAPVADIALDWEGLRAMRAALGEEQLERAFDKGALLTFDEIAGLIRSLKPDGSISAPAIGHGLTERGLDVLRLLGGGGTNQEIGAQLFILPRTVQSHVANILAKLSVSSRAAAATLAEREGLV
jgi:DNA-binding CsgD family transcriptional regulator/tetratricopeptide (TPR) repeat protein